MRPEQDAELRRRAREGVGTYGMSKALGRLKLLHHTGGFLGNNGASVDDVSDATLNGFDGEVRRLLAAAEAQATQCQHSAPSPSS